MQTFPFFSSKGNTAWKEPLNGIWESGWRLRFDYTPIVYLYNCRYMCAYFECMFLERGFWTASEENDQRLVDVCDYTHKISTHNKGLKTAITPNLKHEKGYQVLFGQKKYLEENFSPLRKNSQTFLSLMQVSDHFHGENTGSIWHRCIEVRPQKGLLKGNLQERQSESFEHQAD